MTALNFLVEPQRVCIAMDTLTVDPELKRPVCFCSKMFLLPHLEGVMCGTGALPVIINWFVTIQSRIVVRDILGLDHFTPALLRGVSRQCNLPPETTTTIYHFGYSQTVKEYRAFVYRSVNNFASEVVPHGLRVKPPVQVEEPERLPEGFIQYIYRQREQDRQAPLKEQVGIGGEVQFLLMTPTRFQLVTCHRFEDFETQYQEMLRNCEQ